MSLQMLLIWLLGSTAVRADLLLTNYSTSQPLKIMSVGDSITDDCAINGAWRLYLQPLLQSNGYAFTNLGRFVSARTSNFTQTHHEGICGAVIAFPGMFAWHGYPTVSNYALKTLADALTNTTPDLFLIDLGVNDMGYGRDPWVVATNDTAALLDLIFARAPAAHVIVGKPTSISRAAIGTPSYSVFWTNMHIFCAALESLVNTRRAQGQNVSAADLFSAVDPTTMLQSDGTHPNAAGFNAMAKEFFFRIAAITVSTDLVVTPLIAAGSPWKYSDAGVDLGTDWAQPQYDDSAWPEGSGRLGYNAPGIATTISYGPASTNKYITTYFRHAFVVPQNRHYTNLNVRLNRADSAVVWLNGRELFRAKLPPGPLSFQTRAVAPVVGDPLATYYPTNIAIPSFPAGTNVLAVEVHRFAPFTASLSFDLELFGVGESAPRLGASLQGADLNLRWPADFAGFDLQVSTDLPPAGEWQTLSGPYFLSNGCFGFSVPGTPASQQFFRLRKPAP